VVVGAVGVGVAACWIREDSMIWHELTRFWFYHDLFFATHFPTFHGWKVWNIRRFPALDLDGWHRFHGLWAWVNVHG
jgi:hypothetical protein